MNASPSEIALIAAAMAKNDGAEPNLIQLPLSSEIGRTPFRASPVWIEDGRLVGNHEIQQGHSPAFSLAGISAWRSFQGCRVS
jgi:hypothetical protein